MCYACNPQCGRCRPKKLVSIECPNCGTPGSLKREEYLFLFDLPHKKSIVDRKIAERGGVDSPKCKECGASLCEDFRNAIKPTYCNQIEAICAYPCGLANEPQDPLRKDCPNAVRIQNEESPWL